MGTSNQTLDWTLVASKINESSSASNPALEPGDVDLINASLPEAAPERVLLTVTSSLQLPPLTSSKPTAARDRRKRSAELLGVPSLVSQLHGKLTEEQQQHMLPRMLLALLHMLTNTHPALVCSAMGGDAGRHLLEDIVDIHTREHNLTHMTSHLVVSCIWALATACEHASNAGADFVEEALACLTQMSSHSGVLQLLLSHIVFLASHPDQLFTRAGLLTATRSLRVLFFLESRGTEAHKIVSKLCRSADVTGRTLQIMEYDPAVHLPHPEHPLEAAKRHSFGELYVQLLSSAVAYVGYSSSIFSSSQGQLVLDAASSAAGTDWLLAPGRLPTIRMALDTLTDTLYHNTLLKHIECPETRALDVSVRNLLLMLTLPLCCGKRQPEVIQLTTSSLQLYRALYSLDFLPLFKRMLHASHPPEPSTPSVEPAPGPTTQPQQPVSCPVEYYQGGELQSYFATVGGVFCDALPLLGASMSSLTPQSAEEEADMKALVEQNLPRIVVWSDILAAATNNSQQVVQQGRKVLPYRPATYVPPASAGEPQQDAAAAQDQTLAAAAQGLSLNDGATGWRPRRCAMCGARSSKLLTCRSCGVAVYCGRDCQLSHWQSFHKLQCKQLQQAKLLQPTAAVASTPASGV